MAHKEIRNLKDLSQQQVHQGEILIKYLAEGYSTVEHLLHYYRSYKSRYLILLYPIIACFALLLLALLLACFIMFLYPRLTEK